MSSDQQLRDGRLVFYRDDLKRIEKVLEQLVDLSHAKYVLLVDKEGHMITRAGDEAAFDEDTISALVAGSFSATREMARLLGETQFTAMHHQGAVDQIQLSLVGNRTLLTVLFDSSTTLGMIRLYVGEAVGKLEDLFEQVERSHAEREPAEELEEGFGESVQGALDTLFEE